MRHLITAVEKGSLAEEAGLLPGDLLLSLNGEEIEDEIDYQALIACDRLTVLTERGGEEIEYILEKDDGEALGLRFGESMTLSPRRCRNNCVFCFISQLPQGLRETLYVKDDDWRFSLMMGNYVTLTNVDEKEFQRILTRKPSPLYISVHATDPELRCRMMNNRFAGELMPRLRKLAEAGIRFHCQIVCCPGWNDGEVLDRTLRDLRGLWPAARTVAVVPVGLTRFRENLTELKPFDAESAGKLLDQVAAFQKRCQKEIGTSFVFPSDEFYCLTGRELPPEDWYEDYPQIENGVGLLRRFTEEAETARRMDIALGGPEKTPPKTVVIPTGVSFAPLLQKLAARWAPEGTEVRVIPVKNRFFGETVTVTGLLTGRDILAALEGEPLRGADEVFLCACVLQHERDLFLDDLSLEEFRKRLPVPVRLLENDGGAFYEALFGRFDEDSAMV